MSIPRPVRPRALWPLLLCTGVLAVSGCWLLAAPQHRPTTPARPAATAGQAPVPSAPPDTIADGPAATPPVATPARSGPAPSVPPPLGEGLAADTAIQEALERAWPADLPVSDAQNLIAIGRDLLRADATGAGRQRWAAYFTAGGRSTGPSAAFSRFRIQAVIARKDPSAPNRAVVHAVWAAANRGGTYTDGRITDLHFLRTTTRGRQEWIPQRQP